MATRCDCKWEKVEISPEVETMVLRAVVVATCPFHAESDLLSDLSTL